MSNYCIVTNNPLVLEKYPLVALFEEKNVEGIFTSVRDSIHRGAILISHPLAGSVKPNESPYKSVVISSEKGHIDMKSLQIIEDAIGALKKLKVSNREFSERVLEDFQVIDLDLINSAIFALPAEYHN